MSSDKPVSVSGAWMQTVALGRLALDLTDFGTALGLVTAAQFLPVLFFRLGGNVIVSAITEAVHIKTNVAHIGTQKT